jgi:hypothetical protein
VDAQLFGNRPVQIAPGGKRSPVSHFLCFFCIGLGFRFGGAGGGGSGSLIFIIGMFSGNSDFFLFAGIRFIGIVGFFDISPRFLYDGRSSFARHTTGTSYWCSGICPG